MGLNPFRGEGEPPGLADYAMVVGAAALTLIAILWGFFG